MTRRVQPFDRTPRASRVLALALGLCVLAGCDELSAFRTEPGEVFHGEVIGTTPDPTADYFIREGFEGYTEMDLTFDPALAASPAPGRDSDNPQVAGTMDTYICPPETDLCPKKQRTAGHFVGAELEAITRLNHDALSQYDFPGGGRLRNYILAAHFAGDMPDGDSVDRTALVFLSLMENGKVEARVVAGSVRDADGEDALPPLFGLFVLERRRP